MPITTTTTAKPNTSNSNSHHRHWRRRRSYQAYSREHHPGNRATCQILKSSAHSEAGRVEEGSPPAQPTQAASVPPAKVCSGAKTLTFSPSDPGVVQTGPDGRRVDLGDGGGGSRLEEWKTHWTAPAKVTSVSCSGQRNEHVLAQNKDGSNAECVGSINGGNDAISMHVAWNGPCDQ
jgi:hypothetical protein